jgi:hypothetical protein
MFFDAIVKVRIQEAAGECGCFAALAILACVG